MAQLMRLVLEICSMQVDVPVNIQVNVLGSLLCIAMCKPMRGTMFPNAYGLMLGLIPHKYKSLVDDRELWRERGTCSQ